MLIREEIVTQVGWYREEWATPYMAAVARVVFKPTIGLVPLSDPRLGLPEPDVTLTPQPVSGVLPRYMPLPLGAPDVTLTPQPVEERITALGAEGEWFKEKRGLVIVVVSIVALILLLFFFKKGRA